MKQFLSTVDPAALTARDFFEDSQFDETVNGPLNSRPGYLPAVTHSWWNNIPVFRKRFFEYER